MSLKKLRQAVAHYSTALSAVEDAQPQPSAEQILAVLKARDSTRTTAGGGSLKRLLIHGIDSIDLGAPGPFYV